MSIDDAGPSSLPSAPSYAGPWTNVKPPLDDALLDHITSTLQFSQMTPVQSSVIPLFLTHRDVIVEAVTGSGKTLAYVVPVLQMILRRNKSEENRLRKSQVGGLIICPTRELAVQVHGVLQDFIKSLTQEEEDDDDGDVVKRPILSNSLLVVGGSASSPANDYQRFRELGSDIVIGTPGRVEELLKRSLVDIKELEVLILDEADRLLDLGFSQTIQVILDHLPKQRRTGLFSATMTDALGELARIGLRNPVRVLVKVETKAGTGKSQIKEDKRTPASLQNFFLICRAENKLMQLIRLLRRESFAPSHGNMARKSLVYFSTCAQVNYFYKVLGKVKEMQGIQLYSLHGQQTPSRRTATFEAFVSATPIGTPTTSSEAASVLFCTDVAARGLDLPDVDLVIQFDPPTDPKVFSHRCGRTARAGRYGRAVVFLLKGREEDYVEFLRVRKSPVKPYPYLVNDREAGTEPQEGEAPSGDDLGTIELTKQIKSIVKQDRELYESGIKAFVGFIKCYKKHEASFIFREKDLNFGKIATCFCLLRLPRMPEIDRWKKEHKEEADEFDGEDDLQLDTFAYADKAREKQRLEALEKRKADLSNEKRIATSSAVVKKKKMMRGTDVAESAWSHQKAQKERRDERREKKARKKEYEKKQRSAQQQITLPSSEQGVDLQGKEDEKEEQEDWAQDEREAKKARKTKAKADSFLEGMQFDNL